MQLPGPLLWDRCTKSGTWREHAQLPTDTRPRTCMNLHAGRVPARVTVHISKRNWQFRFRSCMGSGYVAHGCDRTRISWPHSTRWIVPWRTVRIFSCLAPWRTVRIFSCLAPFRSNKVTHLGQIWLELCKAQGHSKWLWNMSRSCRSRGWRIPTNDHGQVGDVAFVKPDGDRSFWLKVQESMTFGHPNE